MTGHMNDHVDNDMDDHMDDHMDDDTIDDTAYDDAIVHEVNEIPISETFFISCSLTPLERLNGDDHDAFTSIVGRLSIRSITSLRNSCWCLRTCISTPEHWHDPGAYYLSYGQYARIRFRKAIHTIVVLNRRSLMMKMVNKIKANRRIHFEQRMERLGQSYAQKMIFRALVDYTAWLDDTMQPKLTDWFVGKSCSYSN